MNALSPPCYVTDPISSLSPEDRECYTALQMSFAQAGHPTSRDRRATSFCEEIARILRFVDRRNEDRELRVFAAGVAKMGNVMCVNTRQLKKLLRRCKSSINNSFQQIGFVAVKMKPCDDPKIAEFLPGIANFPFIVRQWTVRSCQVDVIQPHLVPRPVSAAPDHRIFTVPIIHPRKLLPLPQINGPAPPPPKPEPLSNSVWMDSVDDPAFGMDEEFAQPLENEPFLPLDSFDFGFSAI